MESERCDCQVETTEPVETPGIAARSVLLLIRAYQRYLSPLTPPVCRFHPTCSHYTYQAVSRYGILRGLWLGLKRICRCHPLCKGGYDPVPDLQIHK